MSALPHALQPLWRGRKRLTGFSFFPRISTLAIFRLAAAIYLLAYGYLGFRLIHFQQSAFHFKPNARIGNTTFKLLKSKFSDSWQGGPSCTHYQQDFLLIQASAACFEDLISYSRLIASPNDHDLVAVFVRDSIPGQPWELLARNGPHRVDNQPVYPENWVAKLSIRQGGMVSDAVTSQLLDIAAYRANGELWAWQTKTNFHTDSVFEKIVHWNQAEPLPSHVSPLRAGRLRPADAAYHSPYRLRLRQKL